jgi:hypothetical protein
MNNYVYIHIRRDTGRIFYVGRGRGQRAWAKTSRNVHWKSIVKKTAYSVEILFSNLSLELSCKLEELCIKVIGLKNLANKTSGGEGILGFKHSEDSKLKMSHSKKGRTACNKGIPSPRKGCSLSPTIKEKMAKSKGGKAFSVYKAIIGKRYSCSKGQLIGHFENQNEASRILDVPTSNINNCLKGFRGYAKGFIFEFRNEEV